MKGNESDESVPSKLYITDTNIVILVVFQKKYSSTQQKRPLHFGEIREIITRNLSKDSLNLQSLDI